MSDRLELRRLQQLRVARDVLRGERLERLRPLDHRLDPELGELALAVEHVHRARPLIVDEDAAEERLDAGEAEVAVAAAVCRADAAFLFEVNVRVRMLEHVKARVRQLEQDNLSI